MITLEVKFPVIGKSIPADHGYALYSAICRQVEEIHEWEDISIGGISGIPDKHRNLHLQKSSKLRMRIPSEKLSVILKLAGKEIFIQDSKVRLQIPTTSILKPHRSLYSRLVFIKTKAKFTQESFLESVNFQLRKLNISKEPVLFYSKPGYPFVRKTIQIKDKTLVGYPLLIPNLEPDESILLQTHGLGGKRKMGCGNFVGVRI
jgi:CRISPR-associated protein Cas6